MRITADVLNIRSGAGMQFDPVGVYTKDTICELIEIQGNWGKTNRGWISLEYVQEA